MGKIKKTFSMNEETYEYICGYQKLHELATTSAALEAIVNECKAPFDEEEHIKALMEKVNNEYELNRMRVAISTIDKRLMVMYEMMNNLIINAEIPKFISSDVFKPIVTEKSEKKVSDDLHNKQMRRKKKRKQSVTSDTL